MILEMKRNFFIRFYTFPILELKLIIGYLIYL